MPPAPGARGGEWLFPSLTAALALLVLRIFPAAALRLVPPCPFYHWTGLLCPGCGSTRAVLALLDGRLGAAWLANPLLLVALPCVVAYGLVAIWRRSPPTLPRGAVWCLVLAVLTFGVARDLPLW